MASPSDNPLKRLIREIHRRSLWQVLGIYLVASWAVLSVVDTLVSGGALNLPDWFPAFALGPSRRRTAIWFGGGTLGTSHRAGHRFCPGHTDSALEDQ